MDYTTLTDDELAAECGRLFALAAETKAALRLAAAEKSRRDGEKELSASQLVQRLKGMTAEEYAMLRQLVEAGDKATETEVHTP